MAEKKSVSPAKLLYVANKIVSDLERIMEPTQAAKMHKAFTESDGNGYFKFKERSIEDWELVLSEQPPPPSPEVAIPIKALAGYASTLKRIRNDPPDFKEETEDTSLDDFKDEATQSQVTTSQSSSD